MARISMNEVVHQMNIQKISGWSTIFEDFGFGIFTFQAFEPRIWDEKDRYANYTDVPEWYVSLGFLV
jgi:hypothetical protein